MSMKGQKNRRFWGGLCLWIAIVIASVSSYAQSINVVVAPLAGVKQAPTTGGNTFVNVKNGTVDITDNYIWIFKYTTKKNCGYVLQHRIYYLVAGIKIEISGDKADTAQIRPGIYEYTIQGFGVKDTITRGPYTLIVKSNAPNKAPSILTGNEVDTTLETGTNTLGYMEVKGAFSDDCTDEVAITWNQLEGPTLQNYDSGTGNLILQNAPAGTYLFKLTATDDRGGSASRTVKVYIRTNELPSITLMKAFSPNEDGVDDTWKVANISTSGSQYSVKIMNQQGYMVLHAKPPFIDDTIWDGTLYGKPMPEGAYYYMVVDKSNQIVTKGSVVLVR